MCMPPLTATVGGLSVYQALKSKVGDIRQNRHVGTTLLSCATVVSLGVAAWGVSQVSEMAQAQGAVTYAPASGLPSFRLAQPSGTISPTEAVAYYGSAMSGSVSQPSARITSLARALEHNPDRIYDFVRNGVEFEPQFGLHKGGEGVLLDGAGGAFDQSQLMVELLRASGINARYVLGRVTLGAEASSILKVEDARQACQLLAASGTPSLINGQTQCASVSGALQSVDMLHVWVEAYVDNAWHAFDPSLKQNTRIPSLDLWQLMGANANGAWNNVSSGVSNGQQNVTGLNQANIDAKLTTYAANLQAALMANHSEKGLQEVVGGWEITQNDITPRHANLPGSSIVSRWEGDVPAPYRASLQLQTAGFSHTYDLPSIYAYRTQGQLQGSVFKVAVRKCEHLNGSAGAYFQSDNGVQAFTQCEQNNVVSGVNDPSFETWDRKLLMHINHPYAANNGTYADEIITKRIEIGKRIEILVRTAGGTGQRSQLWSNAIDPLLDLKVIEEGSPYECQIYGGPAPDVPIQVGDPCHTGTGAEDWNFWIQDNIRFTKGEVVAAEMKARKDNLLNFWVEAFDQSVGTVGSVSGARIFHQHSIGIALNPSYSSSVLDIDTVVGISARGSDQPHYILNALATFSAGAEAASIAHIRAQEAEGSGIASNGMTVLASATSITKINPGTSTNSLPGSVPAPVKAEVDRYLSAGFEVAVPSQGGGFFARRTDGSEQAWIVGQGTKGTYHKDNVDPRNDFRKGATDSPRPLDFLGRAEASNIAANVAGTHLGGVDLRSGSLSFGAGTEVSVGQGDFPYSLTFSRRYASSGPAAGFGELGAGWTHNWESSAYQKQDWSVLVSENDPVASAPTIVALLMALQGGRENTLEASLVSGFVMNWWQAQGAGYGSVALVNGGGSSGRFVRLANGQWRNPSSPSEQLTIGAINTPEYLNFTRTLADGSVQRFRRLVLTPGMSNYNDPQARSQARVALTSWEFPSGINLTLNYTQADATNAPYLQSVQNNLGASISFSYSANPSRQQQDDCLALAAQVQDGGQSKKQCQVAARSGGRLSSVSGGSTAVSFGYYDDCHINTSYCAYYLTVANQAGKRQRQYQYAQPEGAAAPGIFGYQRLLTVVSDQGLVAPVARYTWQGTAGLVAPKVIESYDAQGRKTEYFSTNGLLSSSRDAMGGVMRQAYDPAGRLVKSSDALGRTSHQRYYGGGWSASVESAWGDVTSFKYDARSNLVEKAQSPKAGCGTDAWWCQTIVTKAEYHPTWNKPTKIILPATIGGLAAAEWTFSYNAQGLLQEQRSPAVFDSRNNQNAQAVTKFWYDSFGRQTRIQDPTGIETTQVWGGGGMPAFCLRQSIASSQSGGLNLTTNYSCNTVGDVTSVTDPRGNTTTTAYDGLRRKTAEVGPASTSIQTQWVYDLDGNVIEEKKWDAPANVWRSTVTTYSLTGKPLTVTDASGDISRTCYDALDRAVVAVDPTGRATRTIYNAASQPTDIERWYTANVNDAACALTNARPDGINTNTWRKYEYNAGGLQSAEIDANGNRTQMTYEGLGRLIVTTFADGADAWSIHDQRGQVVVGKTRGNEYRDIFHDQLGRIHHVWETNEYANAQGSRDYLKGRNTRTGYDLAGRIVWKDVSNQPTTTWNDALRRDVHIYGYDAAGRPTQDQVQPLDPAISGSVTKLLTYGYDAAGNRTSITWPDGFVATYAYDAANRPQTVTFGGHTATISHDSLGRRTGLNRSSGANTIYAYKPDNDLLSLAHNWNASANQTAAGWTYVRDAAGRITEMEVSRLDLEWLPTMAYAKTYGPANNLNQVASQAGQALTFNANGNLASFQGATYTWALGNRLESVTRPGMSATYAYDGEDRRTMKTVDGVITRTLWSGADEVAEMDGAGNILRRFIPDGSGAMDGRLATLEANGTIYWHHTDHQGSVVATSNSAGAPVSIVNYSPNGEMGTALNGAQLTAPPTGSPFGYTGRQYDPETGLWQYRARYYHAQLGQFLSQDPIGTKDDPNLYLYVANDPVNNTDPTGMQSIFVSGGGEISGVSYPSTQNHARRTQEYYSHTGQDRTTMVVDYAANMNVMAAGIAAGIMDDAEAGRSQPLDIVGYSLGGPRAAVLANKLHEMGISVRNVVTVDPVGGGVLVKDSGSVHTNITANPDRMNFSDVVAGVGGKSFIITPPDRSTTVGTSHGNFDVLMGTKGADGLSADDLIRKPR